MNQLKISCWLWYLDFFLRRWFWQYLVTKFPVFGVFWNKVSQKTEIISLYHPHWFTKNLTPEIPVVNNKAVLLIVFFRCTLMIYVSNITSGRPNRKYRNYGVLFGRYIFSLVFIWKFWTETVIRQLRLTKQKKNQVL